MSFGDKLLLTLGALVVIGVPVGVVLVERRDGLLTCTAERDWERCWRQWYREFVEYGDLRWLLCGICAMECNGNPNPGVGADGEVGIMQMLPATALELGWQPIHIAASPMYAIAAAWDYLQRSIAAHNWGTGRQHWQNLAAAYNGGDGGWRGARARAYGLCALKFADLTMERFGNPS